MTDIPSTLFFASESLRCKCFFNVLNTSFYLSLSLSLSASFFIIGTHQEKIEDPKGKKQKKIKISFLSPSFIAFFINREKRPLKAYEEKGRKASVSWEKYCPFYYFVNQFNFH